MLDIDDKAIKGFGIKDAEPDFDDAIKPSLIRPDFSLEYKPMRQLRRKFMYAFAIAMLPRMAFAQTGPVPSYDSGPDSLSANALALLCLCFMVPALIWLIGRIPISGWKQGRGWVSAIAIGLYVLACALPAVEGAGEHICSGFDNKPTGTILGVVALVMGWIPPYTIPWFANILFIVGLILFISEKHSSAVWCSGIALVLAATTIVFIFKGDFAHVGPGFVLWQAALATVPIGVWNLNRRRASAPSSPEIGSDVKMDHDDGGQNR